MQPLSISRLKKALDGNYVLVLTTNSIERQAVTENLEPSTKAEAPVDNDGVRLGLIGGQFVLNLTGTSGGQADKAVGRITRTLLADRDVPRPNAVILVGLAWGAPALTSLKDVIVSAELLAVNRIRFDGGELKYGHVQRLSPWTPELESVADELRAVVSKGTALHEGALISAEQHIASGPIRDGLLAQRTGLLGGEMEGWDLVPDLQDLPWMQVRGVCDFAGNDTDRMWQRPAAKAAANLLPPLLSILEERGLLSAMRRDQSAANLLEVLSGSAMEITEPTDRAGLNDHLNDTVGPPLTWRLAQYAIGIPVMPSLPRTLANLLLEISQNALRHGGATRARISFGGNSITYEDDGRPFDLFSLSGNRGGRRALEEVLQRFVDNGVVEIRVEPARGMDLNRYVILFVQLSAQLRNARDNCPIEISFGHFGYGRNTGDALRYDEDCDWLYFDTRYLLMSSRRLDVSAELRGILEKGKGIFLVCLDEYEQAEYEDTLGDVSDGRLVVIVAPRT